MEIVVTKIKFTNRRISSAQVLQLEIVFKATLYIIAKCVFLYDLKQSTAVIYISILVMLCDRLFHVYVYLLKTMPKGVSVNKHKPPSHQRHK